MPRTTTTRRRARLGAAGALVAATLLATACQPQPPAGVNVAVTGTAPRLTLSITMRTAGALAVTCDSAGRPVVAGSVVNVRCVDVRHLALTGSVGADTVDLDLRGFTRALTSARLGAGPDTAVARHRGDSEIRLYGEGGADTLSSGFDPSLPYNPNASDNVFSARDVLDGGPGDDRLTDLGHLGPGASPTDPVFLAVALVGGPGVDTIVGAADRPEVYDIDLDDVPLRPSSRPLQIVLTTRTASEQILVHNDGNHGTQVTVTAGANRAFLDLPDPLVALQVRAGAGDDRMTIDHKSYLTGVRVDGGEGADSLHLHPRNPYRWDGSMGLVVQPGAASWEYDTNTFTAVTLDATWP